MEPSCVQFLENKTVLVTGASGFLAKGNNLYTLIYHDISAVEYISSLNLFNGNYLPLSLSLIGIYCSSKILTVFVERVLRLQPNLKRLYLLVRASDNKAAKQRLHNEVYLHTRITNFFVK